MKKPLLLLSLCFAYNFAWSQLPYMSTPTVIPQFPTSSDVIKIITKIITANQGIVVDQTTFSMTQSPNEINIRGCYWNGMLPATQDFIDTLVIGQLPSGTYAIKHKAYMSSGQQVCHKTDSNLVTLNFSVSTLTGIEKQSIGELAVFPNPASDKIFMNSDDFSKAMIYSCEGRLLKIIELQNKTEIDILDLSQGLYFISFSNSEQKETVKFIKL